MAVVNRFLLLIIVVALPLTLLVSTEAFAQEAISVTPSSGPPGRIVTVSGTGWREHGTRGMDVPIWIDSGKEVARGDPNANGEFSVSFAIPSSSKEGPLKLSAIIGNGGSADTFYTVMAADAASDQSPHPGASSSAM